MTRRFQLHNLALHYIGVRETTDEEGKKTKEVWQRQAPEPQDVDGLDETISDHLLSIIEDNWDRSEDRAVHSARFDPDADAERARLKGYLEELEEAVWPQAPSEETRNRFFELSRKIADRLFDCTTLAASSGLLMLADFSRTGHKRRYLALLKIRHKDEKFTVLQESLTSLDVHDVKMMLTRDVLKGIIHPHPSHPGYHLKLIDEQARHRDKPARYFTEEFLGCPPKPSDAKRAADIQSRLAPEIAKRYGLETDLDRLDDFVARLEEKTEPTADRIAEVALETGVFADVPRDDLRAAVAREIAGREHEVVHARLLQPALQRVGKKRSWTHREARAADFQAVMDRSLRLDDAKVVDSLLESGIVPGLQAEQARRHLEESGGVDVPREQVVMRKKKQRRLLEYVFRVPREPGSQSFEKVTITGPAVTLRRFLTKDGNRYVFTVDALETNFSREYR